MHGFLGSQRSNSGSCDARPVTTGCPRAPGVLPPLRQAPVAAPPQEVLEEAQGAAVPDSTGSCDDEEQEEEDAYLGDVGGRVSGKKRLRTSVKGGGPRHGGERREEHDGLADYDDARGAAISRV